MQDGHDHFKRGESGALMMFLYGDAASVVFYSDRTIRVDRNLHCVGIAGHHFVDAIIDNFINQVMQPALISRANIHAWAHTYRLKTFENLNVLLSIITIPIPVHFSTASRIPTTATFIFSRTDYSICIVVHW